MFLVLVLLTAEVGAQQPAKIPEIGCLWSGSAAEAAKPGPVADRVRALRAGLRDHGYVEGKNITLVFRWAETTEQLPVLAADLVRLKVDLIFANSSTEVEATRRVTKTIPIVFGVHADPVGLGHVASLARPGGNITGLSAVGTELVTKELEILKQALPQMTRVGVVLNAAAPWHRSAEPVVAAAAQRLGVQIVTVWARTPDDLDGAFARMARERVHAFLFVPSPLSRAQRTLLAELSLKYRLAGMFGITANAEAGGLMSFAADFNDLHRRAAAYIDKILKGAKPADLPVEQASKYELVINLKTAKALGIAIAPSVLARADRVIE